MKENLRYHTWGHTSVVHDRVNCMHVVFVVWTASDRCGGLEKEYRVH